MSSTDFEIQFCKTNLSWLLGNPESEDNTRRIAYMEDRIAFLEAAAATTKAAGIIGGDLAARKVPLDLHP